MKKTMNLFKAIPFVAQTHFESRYCSQDEFDEIDICRALTEVYELMGEDKMEDFNKNINNYSITKRMLVNAVDLIYENPEEYNKYCRVDTIKLNNEYNIGYNS